MMRLPGFEQNLSWASGGACGFDADQICKGKCKLASLSASKSAQVLNHGVGRGQDCIRDGQTNCVRGLDRSRSGDVQNTNYRGFFGAKRFTSDNSTGASASRC